MRRARLNPFDLDWRRFLVAEQDSQIAGMVQVGPHSDGSRELASLAVLPAQQGQGTGGALIGALLERERGPLHLMCRNASRATMRALAFAAWRSTRCRDTSGASRGSRRSSTSSHGWPGGG